jgi:SAM-dependent methyltransferase
MHTRISPENPYGYSRHGFAWEHVPAGGAAHLDFGCGDGGFLRSLSRKGIGRLVGVDISADAAARAADTTFGVQVVHIRRTVPLPFHAGSFSSASLLDVLEHVHEQQALLQEISRVVVPGGVVIVTVPRRHVFSFLDLGNLKFLLPGLHRWYYCRRHSREEYHQRYVANPDGLIGDISARKRWHEHFTPAGLERLLRSSGLSLVGFDGTGLLHRPIDVLGYFVNRFAGARRVLARLADLDDRRYQSANLFCLARTKED